MYLEDRLEELCQKDFQRKDKLTRWLVIKQDASKLLETVCTHFPHFSKHDCSHSMTIGVQIGRLLGKERIDKLSCTDILILLASFYLHDVGMALNYEEIYERLTSRSFQDKLEELSNEEESELKEIAERLKNFSSKNKSYEYSIDVYNDVVEIVETVYRSEHGKRSSDYIKKQLDIKQCFGERCQKLLARICDLHQKPISEIMEIPYKENGFFGDYFHPRFIAAMLCLGDLMDLDTDRFDETSLRAVSPMPRISKLHLRKHESIIHYLVDVNEIRVISNTDDISVYNVMRQWLDWMQGACEYISLHWSEISPADFGNAPRFIERELLLKNEKIRSKLANLHYQISGRRMYQLMEGGGIYRNKLVCIREIIQNAVDATIYRLFDEEILKGTPEEVLKTAEELDWSNYKIVGRIEKIDDTHVEIFLRDRGIGVSEEDLYKISHVSNRRSEHVKDLIKKMPPWIRPAGVFGIGLQSIFLLADEFTMITKSINEPPKKITFQSSSKGTGYILVEEHKERFTQGTEVRFMVDVSKMSVEELRCSNYHYRRNLLSVWFLKRIMLDYSNKLPAVPPIRDIRKKRVDVVPIELSVLGFESDAFVPLLQVDSFFSHTEDKISIKNGFISTGMFFPDLNCHLSCNIILKKNENHLYETIEKEFSYLNNAVFFRHEYVVDDCLEHSIMANVPVLPYIDWRIDLMGGETDKILNLNRNAIREEYAQDFLKLLLDAIKRSICKIIDYLLAENETEGKFIEIEDTILLIYQFSRQYVHRCEELYERYKNLLEKISIGNYIGWKDQESIHIPFNELMNKNLYFVMNEVDENLLSENIRKNISNLNADENFLFCLDKGEWVHILNHRAEKVSVAMVGDDYLEVVKATPFDYLDPMKRAMEMDDMALLRQIIRMLKLHIRGLPVLHGYETLATPVNPANFSIKYSVHVEAYLIELPLGEYNDKLYTELSEKGYVVNACDKYLEKIVCSALFMDNVEYIESYHKSAKESIIVLYKKLIEKMLRLLEDGQYKTYNQFVLKNYSDPRVSMHVLNGRDTLEANCYLATVVSV